MSKRMSQREIKSGLYKKSEQYKEILSLNRKQSFKKRMDELIREFEKLRDQGESPTSPLKKKIKEITKLMKQYREQSSTN